MAGMTKGSGQGTEMMASINVTPFVDIVLVLLVVLMVTSVQIVKASFEVDLPSAASGGQAVDSTLNIVINKEGDWLLDGQKVGESELVARVQKAKQANPKVQAVIDADRSVQYDRVVHAIDIVKSNGVTKFALNLQRSSANKGPAKE